MCSRIRIGISARFVPSISAFCPKNKSHAESCGTKLEKLRHPAAGCHGGAADSVSGAGFPRGEVVAVSHPLRPPTFGWRFCCETHDPVNGSVLGGEIDIYTASVGEGLSRAANWTGTHNG